MYREPCAKFSTPSTPKISVRPEAMRNRNIACVRPFRHWTTRKPGSARPPRSNIARPAAAVPLLLSLQCLQLVERSHRLLAADVRQVADDEERVLGRFLEPAEELPLVRLVVGGA